MKSLVLTLLALVGTSVLASDSPGLEIVAQHTAVYQPAAECADNFHGGWAVAGQRGCRRRACGAAGGAEILYRKKRFLAATREASPETAGNLTLAIPALGGRKLPAGAGYGECRGPRNLHEGCTTVTTRSWVDANQNLLVTELRNRGRGRWNVAHAAGGRREQDRAGNGGG